MPDYSKAKIYKIESICDHEEDEIYIGSTTKETLAQRMTAHRGDYNKWKDGKGGHIRSFDLFEKYGISNCKIYLLESYPCQSRDELTSREGHFIRTLKCVNKNVAGRSVKESQKKYRQENKDIIKEYHKIRYDNNKDIIKESQKKYYEKNKEKKLQKNTCICGCEYTHVNFQRHCRTKLHQDYFK
jgi:hypothetical protein